MFFYLSKILWFFADPGNLLLIILAVSVALLWSRWYRVGRWLLLSSVIAALFFAIVPVGYIMTATLEDRFPAIQSLPQKVDGIIVLGGVIDPYSSVMRGSPSVNGAVERLVAFARLAKKYPDAKLVFTSGSGDLTRQDYKEAHFVGPFLSDLGLAPERVIFEDQSRNSYENAVLSKKLVNPKPGKTWVLITSAFHMPRAVGCFRRIGWDVLPYVVDYNTSGEPPALRFNFLSGIGRFRGALHEWLGLAFYWLTDRTSALFPEP